MKTDIQVNGTTMTIAIEGRLDTLTAPELQAELANYRLGELTEITMDLSQLEYISSAGLRVLLQAYRSMKMGGVMRIVNANEVTRKVFDVTGFDEYFSIE
ncbi:MAG: STAS domain-containing protein [Clostridia bacterium]|nr:STAS domain-containing protein [Clostridia bacterium]